MDGIIMTFDPAFADNVKSGGDYKEDEGTGVLMRACFREHKQEPATCADLQRSRYIKERGKTATYWTFLLTSSIFTFATTYRHKTR